MEKVSLEKKLAENTSDLLRRNEELRRSEERYHQMIAEVQDYAIILLNKDGIIQNWNKGAEKIKGYSAEEAVGKSFNIFYSEEDRQRKLPNHLLQLALSEGRATHEGWRIKKDGTRFWGSIVITALHDANGHVIGFSKVTRDLTDKREAELKLQEKNWELEANSAHLLQRNEELRQSEERFHQMIAEVQDYAIILLSKDGIIMNWNKGAENIKGYSAQEAIGKSFNMFYGEEDRQRKLPDHLLKLAATEGRATHEGWRIRKGGTRFWGSIVITALHNSSGNIIGFSKVTRDLTDRREAEVKLQEKNRELEAMNQELASFAYVSSHDLQEPLRKIQTFASRIMETEYGNLSVKGKDYFVRMQNAALRMQTLIEDLLAYSRTNTTDKNFELTDLNKIFAETKHELKEIIEEKKGKLTASSLPTIEVIPFQFRQLLLNIIGNAVKFSKENEPPVITISCEIVEGASLATDHIDPQKKYYHISINDNGIGFEPEHNQRIFELFQRLHGRSEYSGTGIGLAICKKIMDNHGGVITAESELDEGATFHLYFPIQNEKALA